MAEIPILEEKGDECPADGVSGLLCASWQLALRHEFPNRRGVADKMRRAALWGEEDFVGVDAELSVNGADEVFGREDAGVGGMQRFYASLFNELEEGVIESLATQPELLIMFGTPRGERVGSTVLPNGMRGMMQRQLATISLLAEKSPWEPRQFAAAKAIVEAQFPTAAALWEKLGE